MSVTRCALLLCLALPLAACGGRDRPAPALAAPSAAETVAPRDAAARWSGDAARLTFGPPQTDDVRLALACVGSGGEVELSTPVRQSSAAPSITIRADADTRSSFLAAAAPSRTVDGVILTARTTVRDPVLRAFARYGRLGLVEGAAVQTLDATEAERGLLRAFFDACR